MERSRSASVGALDAFDQMTANGDLHMEYMEALRDAIEEVVRASILAAAAE